MPVPADNSPTERSLRRHAVLKRKKQPWLQLYQLLGEYIHTRKQEFLGDNAEGEFLNRDLFDSVAPKAAKISASSLRAMLWPDSGKKFSITPPRMLTETVEIKEFYEFMTDDMLDTLDDSDGGLKTALDETTLDDVVFGTSGLEVFMSSKGVITYRPWGVKHMSIAEGENGRVDTVYIEVVFPVSRVVAEYGEDKVSKEVLKMWKEGQQDDDVKVLMVVEPRVDRDKTKQGSQNMPWRSQHIDIKHKHEMRSGGFEEMTIMVTRLSKIIGEVQGRSFGMDALPDTFQINAVKESVVVAIEKMLDPPLGVTDDGSLGGGEIDTSAGAINVFNLSGRAGETNPIFPLFTVGEIKQPVQLLEMLKESINDHFSIDRLLDFNNESQMTLGETQIRDRLRNATLSALFTRQITEKYSPLIERTFNMKLKRGDFGVLPNSEEALTDPTARIIPEAVAELMQSGQNVYNIRYFTPAQRALESEEANGIIRSWELASTMAAQIPDVLDNLDADEGWRKFRVLVGGVSEMTRAKSMVKDIRIKRMEAEAERQQKEDLLAASEGARNLGQSGLVGPQGGA